MSLSTQAIGFVSKNLGPGAIWNIFTQGLARGKDVGSYAKSVVFGSWDVLKKENSPRTDTIMLLKLGLGVGGTVTSSAIGFRNYEEGRAVTTFNGNNDGSVVWSGAQALMHGFSSVLTVSGMLMPRGPARWIMANIPAVAALPALGAIAMDHFQSLCTCGSDHFLAKISQFGLTNSMINLKASENLPGAFRSNLLPWWSRNIRPLDQKFFKIFGIDFKTPNAFIDRPQAVTIA